MNKLTVKQFKEALLARTDHFINEDTAIGAGIYHLETIKEEKLRRIVEETLSSGFESDEVICAGILTEEDVISAIEAVLEVVTLIKEDYLPNMVTGYLVEKHGVLFLADMDLIEKLCNEHEH